MEPLVFHDPTAQVLTIASAATLLAAELALNWRTRHTRGATSDRGTYWTFGVALALGVWIAARAPDWAPGASLSDGAWWPVIAGLVLFWAGVALRWWAILTLGRYFQLTVVVQAGQRVIDTGPYRWVRHPSYTGTLLLMLGVGLAFDNLVSAAACPTLTALGMLRRIGVEERELAAQLGEPYRDYARRTRRLIPGVW